MPLTVATELIGSGRCSEMDIVLEFWLSAIYNDEQVQGSDIGPVVYLRNGTGCPLISYSEVAARWGISKTTVGRILKRLDSMDYISLISFPGKSGSVIYLKSYLSTMFQISDVLIDKEEVAMVLNITLTLPERHTIESNDSISEHEVCVSEELSCISKTDIEMIIQKVAKVLDSQGIFCFHCPKARYKLYPLSDDCKERYWSVLVKQGVVRFGMTVYCGDSRPVYAFELSLSRGGENINRGI